MSILVELVRPRRADAFFWPWAYYSFMVAIFWIIAPVIPSGDAIWAVLVTGTLVGIPVWAFLLWSDRRGYDKLMAIVEGEE